MPSVRVGRSWRSPRLPAPGIWRDHLFVDGNKRAAFEWFDRVIGLNGIESDAAARKAADIIPGVAGRSCGVFPRTAHNLTMSAA
ncbi:hypothetical protein [Azospirillum thermophilum]|uniref:hypothetical protein n=1 Tax=Azospirillum thermophilum TaxID=2202148 RepID=UPI0011B730FD|nr:hypothetical protein [Azospirillum thermophilum]